MIVIDPSKGGRESGVTSNGIVEKDYNLLISEYIFNRLKSLGADVKIIRTTDEYLRKNIYYNIDDKNKMINIWIENYNFDEINSMDYKDVRIAIVAPEELKVQTSNKSLLTQYSYKKTLAIDYANN